MGYSVDLCVFWGFVALSSRFKFSLLGKSLSDHVKSTYPENMLTDKKTDT